MSLAETRAHGRKEDLWSNRDLKAKINARG